MRIGPPEIENDGIFYTWNYGKRAYEADPYLTQVNNNKKIDKNFGKAFLGLATLQPNAIKGLIEGLKGEGFDNLFKSTSQMSDSEIALGIGFLLAFSAAPSVGSRLATSRKIPSLKEIKNSKKYKEIFPNNDVNIDAAILTQKYIYESSSPETRLKMDVQAGEYRQAQLRAKQEKARIDKDKKEFDRIQKEINEDPSNDAKIELRKLESEKEKQRLEREKRNLDKTRNDIINDLQKESGNTYTDEEWGDLYSMRFQKNPTGEELFNFKKAELERQIETGESPESVIDAWYTRYGTNEEGVDRDLQELGRQVMIGLDPNGTGEINIDNLTRYVYDNYRGEEREAIIDAYNNGTIWESWKTDYRTYVAGGGLAASGAVGIAESGDTDEEIDLDVNPEDEMDLVEELGRQEEFIKKGEQREVEITPSGETVPVVPEGEKEKGEDRGIPSGEPEPDVPDKPPTMSPDERDAKQIPPTMSPDERDAIETGTTGTENTQDAYDEGETIREDVQFKNIDELLQLSLQTSKNVYEDQVVDIVGRYFRIDGYSVPILFNRQGNKLFIGFRGTDSIANIITDLYTTNPFTIGENKLGFYPFFKNRIIEKKQIQIHAGFLQVLAYPPAKHKRLGQKLEANYTPLYSVVRETIDKYIDEVTDIIFTGHSLGGAIAGICYYLYMNDTYNEEQKITNSVRCVTFGSPRFVLDQSEDEYNRVCPNLIRCWNELDIVTYIPFYRGVTGTNILDGFRHVGKSFCLDRPLARNDINRLLVDYMSNGEKIVDTALNGKGEDSDKLNINMLKDTRYQRGIISGLLDSLAECEVKEEVKEQDILNMENKVKFELDEGKSPESVLSGLGLDKFIQEAYIGEDPRQSQFFYTSLYGFIMSANKLSTNAHRLNTYQKNVDTVISIEIESKVDVLERAESIEEAEIEEVKKVINERIIKEEVKENIERKKNKVPILGFTKDFNGVEVIKIDR